MLVSVLTSSGLVGVDMKAGAVGAAGHPSIARYQAVTGQSIEPGIRGSSKAVAWLADIIVLDDLMVTSSP